MDQKEKIKKTELGQENGVKQPKDCEKSVQDKQSIQKEEWWQSVLYPDPPRASER